MVTRKYRFMPSIESDTIKHNLQYSSFDTLPDIYEEIWRWPYLEIPTIECRIS